MALEPKYRPKCYFCDRRFDTYWQRLRHIESSKREDHRAEYWLKKEQEKGARHA